MQRLCRMECNVGWFWAAVRGRAAWDFDVLLLSRTQSPSTGSGPSGGAGGNEGEHEPNYSGFGRGVE